MLNLYSVTFNETCSSSFFRIDGAAIQKSEILIKIIDYFDQKWNILQREAFIIRRKQQGIFGEKKKFKILFLLSFFKAK